MKLKVRLIISFVLMVFLPVILISVLIVGLGKMELNSLEKTYGVEISLDYFVNSLQAVSESTDSLVDQMRKDAADDPDQFLNFNYLQDKNKELQQMMSFLIIMRDGEVYYQGTDADIDVLISHLPAENSVSEGEISTEAVTGDDGGTYLGGAVRALVRQIHLSFSEGKSGTAYIVSSANSLLPQLWRFIIVTIIISILLLALVAALLMFWIYRGVKVPIDNLRKATKRITSGDYNFTVEANGNDEISDLCRDFEVMRQRLQQSEEEKARYDKESRELISNISHDLKTPITSVKGYVEGIMDGVADTPEKMDRYIKTIYNKTNDMDRLINELTFYSKIDTNRIPYHFSRINVRDYFDDCAEEVSMDLEARKIQFSYINRVDRRTMIIADAEQLKRVINNIISNSIKYMDKLQGKIELRVMDAGDFIQTEIEDNGKGIDTKDLVNIFDRSYRTDAARSSNTGGSGLGLSIAKKIIEDHSGRIWASSQPGHGTTMIFVLRKYQEVGEQ